VISLLLPLLMLEYAEHTTNGAIVEIRAHDDLQRIATLFCIQVRLAQGEFTRTTARV
jgi:hypothetical protein